MYLLEKFPGKGGWTFAAIPEILQNRSAPFGWVKVKGSIDGVEIKNYRLMPMGNGKLFLPVKAEIRKQVNKQAGDWVKVILYADNDALEVPHDLLLCLKDEPAAYKNFLNYTESEQKAYIDWIYAARKEDTKAQRIIVTINRLLRKRKFSD